MKRKVRTITKKTNSRKKTKTKKFQKPMVLLFSIVMLLTISAVIVKALEKKDISDLVTNQLALPHLEGRIEEIFEPTDEVGTGIGTTKEVSIKNTGNTSLFVRVLVLAEIVNEEGIQLPANIRQIDKNNQTTGQIELLEHDSTIWMDGEDGYFYYCHRLEPNKVTEPLFSGIKINESVLVPDNKPQNEKENYYFSYNNAQLKITIKEETITTRGLTYQDVWKMTDETGSFRNPSLEAISDLLKAEKE